MEFESESVAQNETVDQADLDATSMPFVGRWNQLVSSTNWEKGRIIYQWREALIASAAPASEYSDDAWSRYVGGVTGQHVGRLRRVFQRFGQTCEDYQGLYWSHFQAAIDWDDAEMWLEGAVQNRWSVSKMRFQRWETMGSVESQRPDALDIVSSQDEEGLRIPAVVDAGDPPVRPDELPIQGPLREGPDFGDEEAGTDGANAEPDHSRGDLALAGNQVDIQGTLDQLPDDIAQPFRELRDAIARHKASDWETVKRIQVVALVNDLRQLLRRQPASEA